ncbi:MAG TPA: hypothetical protein EYG98_07135 [Sulfurovum sp.]|nr:hypothetical protein [Sulfurovum sp.]
MKYKLARKILMTIIAFNTLHAIEIKNSSHAVDVAGKQRMYTQRMLKDYAMLGMKNTYANAEGDLKKTVDDFDNHLISLLEYTQVADIKKKIKETQILWDPIKIMLSTVPSKEKAIELQTKLDALLKISNETTMLFAKASGKQSGEIINISGRQRMLSQRMASLYMLKAWGVNDPKFKEKLDAATNKFNDSLKQLKESNLNTEEISKLLKDVEKSFIFFKIMNKSVSRFAPTLINKKSNIILKKMNTATGNYVAEEAKK